MRNFLTRKSSRKDLILKGHMAVNPRVFAILPIEKILLVSQPTSLNDGAFCNGASTLFS